MKEGERRTHRLEELARLAFSEMPALLRELRPPEHATGTNAVESGSKEEVASYGLRRALHRLLGVMAPEFPGATLDFAAYQTQALDPARRKRAGAGNALPDTSDECWRRMT